ncbi:MAG: hypothetical protein SFU57_10450 [Gemmatimonadales bacterium]|nr:hypothetical protein [Gemmatimonadales bacterium]
MTVLTRSSEPLSIVETLFTVSRFGTTTEPFGDVRGLIALSDGYIALVDASLPGLIVIDPNNPADAVLLGRPGDGPGEFRSPRLIQAIGTDSLVIFDATSRKILVFSRTAGFLSSVELPKGGMVADPLGYVDGKHVARFDYHRPPAGEGGVRTVESRIFIGAGSDAADTLAEFPGGILSPQGYMFFAWRAVAAIQGEYLWFGQGNLSQLSRLKITTSATPQIFTWAQVARPVTDNDRKAMTALASSLNAPPNMFTQDRFADSVPLFSRIIPMTEDQLALVGYEPPEGWSDSLFVLDLSAKVVIPMALPDGFRPAWISDSLMIGVSLTGPDGPALVGFRISIPHQVRTQ